MPTEDLLPHEELLVEIARACRRFGVMPPLKEFIYAAYERIKPIEQLDDWEDSVCGALWTLSPRDLPEYWRSNPKATPNEGLCRHCLKKFKKLKEEAQKS